MGDPTCAGSDSKMESKTELGGGGQKRNEALE